MKAFTYRDFPIKVFGIPNFEFHQTLQRLPDELIATIPSLEFLGRRPAGARLGFRTNSRSFTVKIELQTLSIDIGMSIYACQSAFVFLGERPHSRLLGLVNPSDYEDKCFQTTFETSGEMEDVTVFLPRNEIIKNVTVLIEDDAQISEPTPYRYSKPLLFYGSSITEGGISGNIASGYIPLISRHLDADYYNLGFSGNAKGELEMADFISSLDISAFIYDYDHNAPTVEHLKDTHQPFFNRIREKKPYLPIVMMSRPYAHYGEDEIKRRAVIKSTYEDAIAKGDKNVYIIDGEEYFKGFEDKDLCFIDTIHPTDLGFFKMAEVIEPVIRKILEGTPK
ncbi:MAG: hypothetical protein J6B29_04440 [Clostridia bacterium]|nr:hypothetical protein [Clostridia bacterium]